MAGIGSFLGGAAQGIQAEQKQMLAEKTQADENALAQERLGLAKAASGRAAAGDARAKVDGVVNDLWATMENMSTKYQAAGHHPEDATPVLMPMAQQAIDLLKAAGRDKDAQVFELKTKALLSLPTADVTPKFVKSGSAGPGQDIYSQVNPAAEGGVQTHAPAGSEPLTLPKDEAGNDLSGDALMSYLRKTDPTTATFVEKTLSGEIAPPSAYQLTKDKKWSKLVALVGAVDPGFDFTKWSARTKAANEFRAGGQNSPAGTISAGQGALKHLAELSDAAVALDNYNTGFPGNDLLNAGRNAIKVSSGRASEVRAFESAAGKFAPEATRLYRGAGGAEADIERELKEFDPAHSPEELAQVLETNKKLMLDKLDVMQGRWHSSVTDKTDFPIYTTEIRDALRRIDENIAKLRGGQPGPVQSSSRVPSGGEAPAAAAATDQQLQTDIANARSVLATIPAANQAAAKAALINKLKSAHPNADLSGF